MCQDEVWPNGMDRGYVYSHEGVCDYWTRRWSILDPRDRFVIKVHQVAHDRGGKLPVDPIVYHAYQIHDSLIAGMDIE